MSFDERAVVARVERVTLRELRLWVRRGWIRPATGERGPVFDEIDIARVRLLCDLRKEMALSNEALPIVLTLIDQLHKVRRDLRHLTEALEEQPSDMRAAVIAGMLRRSSRGDGVPEADGGVPNGTGGEAKP